MEPTIQKPCFLFILEEWELLCIQQTWSTLTGTTKAKVCGCKISRGRIKIVLAVDVDLRVTWLIISPHWRYYIVRHVVWMLKFVNAESFFHVSTAFFPCKLEFGKINAAPYFTFLSVYLFNIDAIILHGICMIWYITAIFHVYSAGLFRVLVPGIWLCSLMYSHTLLSLPLLFSTDLGLYDRLQILVL